MQGVTTGGSTKIATPALGMNYLCWADGGPWHLFINLHLHPLVWRSTIFPESLLVVQAPLSALPPTSRMSLVQSTFIKHLLYARCFTFIMLLSSSNKIKQGRCTA
jgi:hypothetical protein